MFRTEPYLSSHLQKHISDQKLQIEKERRKEKRKEENERKKEENKRKKEENRRKKEENERKKAEKEIKKKAMCPPRGRTALKCDDCSYISFHKSHFRDHISTHIKVKRPEFYKCEYCVYKNKHKSRVAEHEKTCRAKDKPTIMFFIDTEIHVLNNEDPNG